MGDLEGAFLKKNVPGQYSSWTEDADDKSCPRHLDEDSVSDSEDDEFYFQDLPPSTAPVSPHQPAALPLRTRGNTGVKGVIADYYEAMREEQLQKAEENLENMQRLKQATQPSIRDVTSNEIEQRKNSEYRGNDSDDEDGDDEFLRRFRMQRIAQLQNESNALPTFGVLSFGVLSSKTPEEYIDLVDDIDPRVFVIVHLFEPSIATSRMLHSTLDKVAQIMEYAKFIEVNALDANPSLDLICLPAILIYKGGKLVNNVVKFTDGLPKAFTVGDVKDALEAAGVV